VKRFALAGLLLAAAGAAVAQTASTPRTVIPNPPPLSTAPNNSPGADTPATQPPVGPQGGTLLMMLGLDKITGRPTSITAPIGKQVTFATLTITARFCYSTPASETPETAAFVQIEDHRPDQPARKIFSGWMYGSSPGLNGVEHPLYDVWVLGCNNNAAKVAANKATAPVKVQAPDSSDKEQIQVLPEGASQ
jgi:hypothetical protein